MFKRCRAFLVKLQVTAFGKVRRKLPRDSSRSNTFLMCTFWVQEPYRNQKAACSGACLATQVVTGCSGAGLSKARPLKQQGYVALIKNTSVKRDPSIDSSSKAILKSRVHKANSSCHPRRKHTCIHQPAFFLLLPVTVGRLRNKGQ